MDKTTMDTKVCNTCGRELPLSAFYRNPTKSKGVEQWCKECKAARRKANEEYKRAQYLKKLREEKLYEQDR